MAAKKKKSGKKSSNQQQQTQQQQVPAAFPPPLADDDSNDDSKMHTNLTHTNLDKYCCDTSHGMLTRLYYQAQFLTALKPREFDIYERWTVLPLVGIFWTCVILYVYAFTKGFRDGFAGAEDGAIA